MKLFHKSIITLFLLIGTLGITYAGIPNLESQGGISEITKHSIKAPEGTGGTVEVIKTAGISLLTSVKVVVEGVLILFVVYIGVQMILSMGTDEEQLSQGKRQLWYSLIALVFINIPGTLYEAFYTDNKGSLNGNEGYSSWIKVPQSSDGNLFIDIFDFGYTLNGNIIGFLEVIVFGVALFIITLAGLKIVLSRGQEDMITESKNKIMWSIISLVSLGFIESWKTFVYNGKIDDGTHIFETAANLALFFAGPTAIIFLTMAAYYYITSNGDEEKAKKAKTIVVNTLIATVLLLASYTFLLDLATL